MPQKKPNLHFSWSKKWIIIILCVNVLVTGGGRNTMTDFVSTWNTDSFLTYPVGPLGLIAMPGTEEIGEKVNTCR